MVAAAVVDLAEVAATAAGKCWTAVEGYKTKVFGFTYFFVIIVSKMSAAMAVAAEEAMAAKETLAAALGKWTSNTRNELIIYARHVPFGLLKDDVMD